MDTSKKPSPKHGQQTFHIELGSDFKGKFIVSGGILIRDEKLVRIAHSLVPRDSTKKRIPSPKPLIIRA
jgi:hypothetical protein